MVNGAISWPVEGTVASSMRSPCVVYLIHERGQQRRFLSQKHNSTRNVLGCARK